MSAQPVYPIPYRGHSMNILRRLCVLHGISDEQGNRLLELKREFRSVQHPHWPSSKRLDQRNAAILALRAEGASYREIAKRVGCSRQTAYLVCKILFSPQQISGEVVGEEGRGLRSSPRPTHPLTNGDTGNCGHREPRVEMALMGYRGEAEWDKRPA